MNSNLLNRYARKLTILIAVLTFIGAITIPQTSYVYADHDKGKDAKHQEKELESDKDRNHDEDEEDEEEWEYRDTEKNETVAEVDQTGNLKQQKLMIQNVFSNGLSSLELEGLNQDNILYIPAKPLLEHLGITALFYDKLGALEVIVNNGVQEKQIQDFIVRAGHSRMFINGQMKQIINKPILLNGQLYIPIVLLADMVHYQVSPDITKGELQMIWKELN